MPTLSKLSFFLLAFTVVTSSAVAQRAREFQFDYELVVQGLKPGMNVRAWIPVPQSTGHQRVTLLKKVLPAQSRLTTEQKYGNQMFYLNVEESNGSDIPAAVSYHVSRVEVRTLDGRSSRETLSDEQRSLFLAANRKVPTEGRQLDLLSDIEFPDDPLDTARGLYNLVDKHVRYDKSMPGYGNGDVLWVCDSRFGNCTDFHSLFISWARSKGLPARFEIGFPLPPERGTGTIGGYHCWGMFHTEDHGWVPVDISEADKHPELKDYYFGNLTENRIAFTTGRDIDLVPQQAEPPLNYFVYPHVEVDGRLWPKDRIKLRFAYKDLPSSAP